MLKKTLTAAVFTVMATTMARASDLPKYPFIHATGTAFVYVAPDLGEIDFDISAYDPSAEAAMAVVQSRISEIKELLAEQGLPDADVEVRDARREIRKNNSPQPEYDMKCSVHINVRDLSKWRGVMAPLLAKPNLDAFATSFGTTERPKVERELMAQAVHEAQTKADAMASGFGRRVGAVQGVSSGELKNITRAIGLAPSDWFGRSTSAKRTQQDQADLMMVTALKMSQSVDVIFRIK
jgi:uncharacterized protein YggE